MAHDPHARPEHAGLLPVAGGPRIAKDPVCGMNVDPDRAVGSHEHAGQKYFFCSQHCLEKFRAEPARYLAPQPLHGIAPAAPRARSEERRVGKECRL